VTVPTTIKGRIRTSGRFAAVLVDEELADHEQAVLTDFLTGGLDAIVRARDLAPHAVHLEVRETVTDDVDEHGEPIVLAGIRSQTRIATPEASACPDCGRSTQGRAGRSETLICSSLELVPIRAEPCHPECLIACGRSATDG
jgi:hypothetical protein